MNRTDVKTVGFDPLSSENSPIRVRPHQVKN
jgi:hypothetical protein